MTTLTWLQPRMAKTLHAFAPGEPISICHAWRRSPDEAGRSPATTAVCRDCENKSHAKKYRVKGERHDLP